MNRIQSVMRMHLLDKWNWVLIPWMILLGSFGVNLLIGTLTSGQEPIYTGGIASIYIYMLVIGVFSLVQTFPFALGFSIRRTDFFIGTTMVVSVVSAAWAIVLLILSMIEKKTGFWSVELHFFDLPYLHDGTIVEQFIISFLLMLQMYFLGFVITSISRRFGLIGMAILAMFMIILVSIVLYFIKFQNWWDEIGRWFINHTAFELAIWSIPLLVIYLFVSFILVRKSTV
ncbi:hypothetical protein ACTWQL_05990 [Pseudalkalibacillus sp. R45]|uniref:hypothetical protein n=1 Tax=Pseudalkalibacillus sp. R45 TaxID=3457433 RepID=UPI003FCD2A38